jgi:hypothetical protein
MSETSDDQNDDGTKKAALGESNSEDVQEDLVEEIDADNNQISDESASGDSIDMRSSPDENSSVNDPDELEEEASASPATDEGSEPESTDELEEEASALPATDEGSEPESTDEPEEEASALPATDEGSEPESTDELEEEASASPATDELEEEASPPLETDVGSEPESDDQSAESEIEISASLAVIRDDLIRLGGKVEKLENPSITELGRAKNLIILLSAVTGIVMIASITFFIVMSTNVSQKVAELDRVLMAVARRGVQLGDGIEKISEMEDKLIKVIEQNEPIPSSLEGIRSQILNQGRALIDKEEENFAVLRTRFEPITSNQSELEQLIDGNFKKLEKHVEKTVNLKPISTANIEIKKQLEKLNQDLVEVDRKLNDLYVIKQAEMEKVFLELQNSE